MEADAVENQAVPKDGKRRPECISGRRRKDVPNLSHAAAPAHDDDNELIRFEDSPLSDRVRRE